MIVKTDLNFNIDMLISDLKKYINVFDSQNQLAITYDEKRVLDKEPHFVAIGRSPPDIDEWDLTKICPIFQNSYFASMLDKIPYSLQRVRLMRMSPKSTYSMHVDTYKRLHWALITHASCHLTFQHHNTFLGWHIPADGYGYIADTTKLHSAVNPWDQYRYHLVMDIKD